MPIKIYTNNTEYGTPIYRELVLIARKFVIWQFFMQHLVWKLYICWFQLLASKDPKAINQLNLTGESALHTACLSCKPQNVELLLRWGADADIGHSGRHPIHCASQVGSAQWVCIVLACLLRSNKTSHCHDLCIVDIVVVRIFGWSSVIVRLRLC